MFSDPVISKEDSSSREEESTKKMVDMNGVEFTEGCTVQICSEKVRAYQVTKKGYGSFDEDSKSFIPFEGADDGDTESIIPRSNSCLILPKGIRATVIKVYDIDEFDASHPIVVKFVGGDGFEGDFVPPVTFQMHLKAEEIEVVVA